MSAGLNEQITVFIAMAAYGVAVCMVFDILRSIYRIFKPSALTVGIGDIFFWLLLSVTTFFAVFLANNGQIRFFEFLAMILSGIIYFLTVSKAVIFVFSLLLTWVKKFFCFFLKFFLTIMQFLYKMLLRILMCIFIPIFWLLRKLRRVFMFLFFKIRTKAHSFIRNRKKFRKRRIVRAEKE